MHKLTREEALDYHRREPHGKVEVIPTKPTATQLDLSLAYTPGVAEPCLDIEKDPMLKLLEPTFGGINLEDIKAPECFDIEQRLKKEMSIPVFHDDQHGTAIISGAALVNAVELAGKKIDEVRLVFAGAGAAAFGCVWLYLLLGVRKENIVLCDRKGVIYKGRPGDKDRYKLEYASDTKARTLSEAMEGADVFIGLSGPGLITGEDLRRMARDPIVFAMANPVPEIGYDEAKAARPDVIIATGRSDYPNQVNNVLGFPFIFRGALDVRATDINDAMKMAASHALARLAREDVPDSVLKAYGLDHLRFGREYLIPKPFDYRVLLNVAPAVAQAAIDSGVARAPIADMEAYRHRLEHLVSRRLELMRVVIDRAKRAPKRIVFPEGDNPKILRAAKILVDEGIAHPILLARREQIAGRLAELGLPEDRITIVEIDKSPRLADYRRLLHEKRRRDGVTAEEAEKLLRQRNYFGTLMVAAGDADGLISGLTYEYPDTIRPALQVIGTQPGFRRVAGAYLLVLKDRTFLLADTTVNIDPDAETLAEIAIATAAFARRFNVKPRVAMLAFSNFGSNPHPSARKVRRAVEIAREREPGLMIDGEMQADTAVTPAILEEHYPWSELKGGANILIFPELQSANAAYKLIWRLAGAEAIGPILLGMARPVHVLQKGVEVSDIVSMAAICVVDAQERSGPNLA
ncbi:MAG: Malate dehydrogenase (oxaloacetate-decarboxylating) Phosphate acetyltransferase [Acidobacteria bacterium]|nr:Malate dehydrogenase (oxaloacetate-decarboxylating) Phosphate acetyltransferase [Acidobacteriota bacterium]